MRIELKGRANFNGLTFPVTADLNLELDIPIPPEGASEPGPITSPSIRVVYDGSTLTNGDSLSFGTVTEGDPAPSRTLTVSNTGDADLFIADITVPSGFTITQTLPGTLSPGASADLIITMSTASAGNPGGTISIISNDAGNPFNLTASGTVEATPAPELQVSYDGSVLASGDAVSFGTVTEGDPDVSRTFTLKNIGNATLNFTGGTVPSGFTITQAPPASLAPGNEADVTIEMDASNWINCANDCPSCNS